MNGCVVVSAIGILTCLVAFAFLCVHEVASDEPVLYQPKIKEVLTFPPSHEVPADTEFKVYTKVVDKYGQINSALLTYVNSQENNTQKTKMKLVNGTPSNGTYLGIIPAYSTQYYNTNTSYTLNFSDELNYSSKYTDEYVIKRDDSPPSFIHRYHYLHRIYPGFNNTVVTIASDNETGIKNVTVFVCEHSIYGHRVVSSHKFPPCTDSQSSLKSTRMKLVKGDIWNGTYQGIIPIDKEYDGRTLFDSFVAYDYAGLKNNDSRLLRVQHPWWTDFVNNFYSRIWIMGVNNNLTAPIITKIEAPVVNQTIDNVIYFYSMPREVNLTGGAFVASAGFSVYLANKTSIALPEFSHLTTLGTSDIKHRHTVRDFSNNRSNMLFSGNESIGGTVPLFGDSSLYPFDYYYIHLVTSFFGSNTTFPLEGQEVRIGGSTNSTWNASPKISAGNLTAGFGPIFDIDIKRNYTILIVIIPLLAIFYLLGATFIFESSMDQIGNRLTLTLGIFALIFTLPELINSMKPTTLHGQTIADSLLSIIIIATILFTISSIISSSPLVQKRLSRHYWLIDICTFVIMSTVIVGLLWSYPQEVTIWLIPIIIFGLGYGFLLKLLGVSIRRSIWKGFFTAKSKD